MIAIHLRAKNDVNGNPQRCYLILDNDGDAVDAVDEGYMGHGALKRHYADIRVGVTIEVTPAEYKSWLETFAAKRTGGVS